MSDFIIPRDAATVSTKVLGLSGDYLVVFRSNKPPVKVPLVDTGALYKFTYSATPPANPRLYDRWVDYYYVDHIFVDGEWVGLGANSIFYVDLQRTEDQKLMARKNLGASRVYIGDEPLYPLEGDKWTPKDIEYTRFHGAWVVTSVGSGGSVTVWDVVLDGNGSDFIVDLCGK